MEHLGYTNYLTFTVGIWFDNNRKHYDAVRSQAEVFRTSGDEYADVQFSQWLLGYVQQSTVTSRRAAGNEDSIASTFFEYGMGTVDWLQLARKYLEEEFTP